ncbi:hypothetical protein QR97_02265 [Streptomyces sp. PBH53]|uniref:hypothetical protein n=1 Tax=Streptomyces sp. PBH53 TaxID=1577075 RepID=UPI0006552DCA|nr:hypothetical protein [Streptomyces sp. PBH53]AKN68782.1 hypothetical protein QR97_02265 [Streptomyces sp. PBH53]
MSNDAASGAPETALPLGDAALLSAFAKLFKEEVVPAIDERIAAVRGPLLEAYDGPTGQRSVDAKVNGVAVATHTVAISKDKFVIGDEDAFTAFAEERGEAEVIIQARPAFREAMLKRATYDKDTGTIVDKLTGEVIPGISRIPGGKPTGSVTFRWKEDGKEAVMDAFRSGQLDALLRGVPMLPAPGGEQ